MDYETNIGLEIHIQLLTRTKLFCSCKAAYGASPNTCICPMCMGLPGALPVLNRRAVELAITLGLVLGCEIDESCRFDRKNYFYPDNPENYQITQFYHPIAVGGELSGVRIHEMHLEEDAAKLLHDICPGKTLIDFNRAGVPLIEIVTEPDMRNEREVTDFLKELQRLCVSLGVSDCRMNEGSMRVDVNLSVREAGGKPGVRTEMKNINSFRAIERVIRSERERQISLKLSGGEVFQETRRWEDEKNTSVVMRSKEDSKDYRYFPEPDLPVLNISGEWIKEIEINRPETYREKKVRFMEEYSLSEYDAGLLCEDSGLSRMFEAASRLCGNPKRTANILLTQGLRLGNEFDFSPENLAKLIRLQDEQKITGTLAKEIFELVYRENIDPEEYIEENALSVIDDREKLYDLIDDIINENGKAVSDYRAGKAKAMGALVGSCMKKTGSMADARLLRELLEERLDSKQK